MGGRWIADSTLSTLVIGPAIVHDAVRSSRPKTPPSPISGPTARVSDCDYNNVVWCERLVFQFLPGYKLRFSPVYLGAAPFQFS
jgi:hypothetical protein